MMTAFAAQHGYGVNSSARAARAHWRVRVAKVSHALSLTLLLCCAGGAAKAAEAVSDLQPAEAGQVVLDAGAAQTTGIAQQQLAQAAQPQPGATAQPQSAAAQPQSVGVVSSLVGTASVTRKGTSTPLKVQDEIFKGDVLATAASSTLGVIFDDETTFSLTANASISVDDFLYEEGGSSNVAKLKFVQGTVAFVANAVAKTGNMTLSTPTATLGIRGTTGLVEVGANSQTSGQDAIKLYPDADGKVGRIEVTGRDGASLGVLTRPATGLSLQRGPGARVVAAPLQISPQQAARDRNLVSQVHAERQRGQAFVAQRRAARPGGAPRNGIRGEPRPGAPRPGAPSARPPGGQKPAVERRAGPPRPAAAPRVKPQPRPRPNPKRR
jgi:hypothetical protein